MLLSGSLGLVVPEEVGAGDLPMFALSGDVIAENESPVYGSPRMQMDSELPTKRSMYVRFVEPRNGGHAQTN